MIHLHDQFRTVINDKNIDSARNVLCELKEALDSIPIARQRLENSLTTSYNNIKDEYENHLNQHHELILSSQSSFVKEQMTIKSLEIKKLIPHVENYYAYKRAHVSRLVEDHAVLLLRAEIERLEKVLAELGSN